ncbi:D-inositol-3-phosphate glycosyltransferase [subsurface metagenome]
MNDRQLGPDAVVVQSGQWKSYCSHFNLRLWDQPIVGVDMGRFRRVSPVEKQCIRNALGLPATKKIILHVGHLNQGRNLLPLTRFVEKEMLPVVIGSTTSKPDCGLVKSLEAAGVIVICKYLENIEKYYQAADCYVFPTIDPKFCVQIPISIVEAMACGLPVVATRFEGLPLYFPEGYPGLTYVDDLRMLPTKVHDVLSFSARTEPERLELFNWKNIATGLRQFYLEILRNEKE